MNIATINDTLLPVVLFIIYFILASVVQYNLKDKASVSTSLTVSQTTEQDLEESLKSFTWKDAFSPPFDPDPIEENTASVQLKSIEENIIPVVTQKAVSQSSSPITDAEARQSISEIIDRLGKRELRKLCSPLGIKQKTNGTELTTEFMKAIVKRKFDENPFQVVEVMSVREACRRQSRLPQLLPTLSESNQQHLKQEAC